MTGLDLLLTENVIKEGRHQACHGSSCLICVEELWGRHSEIRAVSDFVSCTNMQENWNFVGRKGSEEAENSTGEG